MEKENPPKYLPNHQECGKCPKKGNSMLANEANYYFHLDDMKA